MSLTISSAPASVFVTPSFCEISPRSMVSLLTKSISFHCGMCCSLLSSWLVRSSEELRMPLRHRKAGMTLVPSGVSKKVDGSRKEQLSVLSLYFIRS